MVDSDETEPLDGAPCVPELSMSQASESPSILLVDDGELEEVAQVLEAEGKAFTRYRGGQIPDELGPPEDLLIVTPRRLGRIRRGSPEGARPGYPLRIVGVGEDSPAMRRRLRRSGLHLLVRLPAEAELWRLLIERALYRGEERRRDPRVSIGSSVALAQTGEAGDAARQGALSDAILLDLSNRGCRLQTETPLQIDETVSFTLQLPTAQPGAQDAPMALSGRVRRLLRPESGGAWRAAVVFDDDLSDETRQQLAQTINQWAAGPDSLQALSPQQYPSLPPRALPAMPELTLDDETDPPVRSQSEVRVDLEAEGPGKSERRDSDRGVFGDSVVADTEAGPIVLIGRDLSPGGMRVEAMGELHLGERFPIALHGPSLGEPLRVLAEVIRDDGDDGFALAFREVDEEAGREIEKLVACLPSVESLIEGELANMGAVLSQILRD